MGGFWPKNDREKNNGENQNDPENGQEMGIGVFFGCWGVHRLLWKNRADAARFSVKS